MVRGRSLFAKFGVVTLLTSVTLLAAEGLPRRGLMGVMLAPVTDQNKEQLGLDQARGVVITSVTPDSAAAKAGVKPNDVIIKLADQDVTDLPGLQRSLRKYFAGDTVKFTLLRDKTEKVQVELVPVARPKETSEDYEIIHDFAATKEGKVRTIVTKPKEAGKRPAVLLIQSLVPFTVDFGYFPQHPGKHLIGQLTKGGLVTMRVERLGIGDSEGADAQQVRVPQDVETFKEALRKLRTYDFVDANNVFVFAYSTGGALAPLVVQGEKVKGVITYGAFARPFMDHAIESSERQWKLDLMKEDEIKENREKMTRFIKAVYIEKQTPAEVFAKYPELKELLEKSMQQGDNVIDGIHYEVWQQFAALDLGQAWGKVDAAVLAIWGEADFASERADGEFIAKSVNASHAGKGTFKALPGIDHMWNHAEDQEESYMAGFGGKYNPVLGETIQKWVKERSDSKS